MTADPTALCSVPREYTLAGDGTIKKITLATDVDGTRMDGSVTTTNVWADVVNFQNSNQSGGVIFLAYRRAGAPSALDHTNCGLDLQIGQDEKYPKSGREINRGDQLNLRHMYAKIPAGSWLHIRIPGRGNT